MTQEQRKIKELLQTQCPVFYFYTSERALAQRECFAAKQLLQGEDAETTVLEGPAPDIEQIVMAAGTISFFGTRRVVELPDVVPSAYSEGDLDALCDAIASAENAVFFITSIFALEYGRLQTNKAAQKLIAACKKMGYVREIQPPSTAQLKTMLVAHAKELGAVLPLNVADVLIERCGTELALLENEVDKIAALSGYGTITADMVAALGTQSLEADVFDMIRMLTAKNTAGACKKLHTLFHLQQEPIAITAALIGSYSDLYRVKLGQSHGKNYSTVFKDYGYKGKDFRLKKSLETANRYALGQLERCMNVLVDTDTALKSQPIDAKILLETTICELAAIGGAR